MNAKQIKAKLREKQDRLSTVKMMIRTTKSDLNDPNIIQRSIDQDEATLLVIQKRIAANRARLENGPALLQSALDEKVELDKEIKHLQHAKEIKELQELQSKMAELGADFTPEQLTALVEEMANDQS